MKLYDDMPFQRGETYFGIRGKPDPEAGEHLVGREYLHQDQTYGTGAWVRVRICRNVSGVRLLPGKCVAFQVKPGMLHGAYAIGHSTVWMQKTAVIDELLRFGAPPDDLFYVVVGGPCEAYPGPGQIWCGDYLHAAAGGRSDATNLADPSGRLIQADFNHEGQNLAYSIMNVVGKAMVDRPSGNDPTDRILVQVGKGV